MKKVPVIDVTDGHATVETEGLYRVVFHGRDKDDNENNRYPDEEFLTAEEAIQSTETHNSLQLYLYGFKGKGLSCWAEAVSYKATEKRWEDSHQQDLVDSMSAIAVKHERQRGKKKLRKLQERVKRLKAKAS